MRTDENNHIWLDLEDLKAYGLYRSYEHWVIGRVSGVIICDKEVMYESMPKRARSRVSREELLARASEEEAMQRGVEAVRPSLAARRVLEFAVSDGFRHYFPHYKADHDTQTAFELSKAAAVVQAVLDFLADPTRMGSMDRVFVQDTFFEIIKGMGLKYLAVKTPAYFRYQILNRAMGGNVTEVVKQPRKRNQNARIATDWHLYAIRRLYADPKRYSKVQVADMLNWIIEDCELDALAGYRKLSHRAVQHLINQQMENEVSPWRMGMKHYNDFERGYISRLPALYPGDLWVVDGTKIQRMYLKDGRIRYAYRVFVIDAYSKAVIGSCVLPEGVGENRWAVQAALRMAVKYTGYLPAELLTDNSSAVKAAETARLFERLDLRLRRSKVGNAKDKTIERIIGVIQTRCDKLYDNAIGEGIRSKRKNAHTSPEHQAAVIKSGKIPDFEGLVRQEAEEIAVYNNHAWNGKTSCAELLRKQESPNAIRVEAWEVAQLFWLETEVTVRSRQITFTVQGEDREYQIWEHADAARLNNTRVKVKYDLHDRSEVYVFDMAGENLECVCRPKKKPHMAAANQTEEDGEMYVRQTAHLDAYLRHLEQVNTAARHAGEGALGQDVAEETGLVLTDAEAEHLLLYPFANARDVKKRFKNDIEKAESRIMTNIMLDEHGVLPGTEAESQVKDTTAMNPLEDGYAEKVRVPKVENLYFKPGSMADL